MFCPKCGHKSELQDQRFCHNCGFDLSKFGESEKAKLKELVDRTQEDPPNSKPSPSATPDSREDKTPLTPNVKCPYCSEDIEINQAEVESHKFTCPTCDKEVELYEGSEHDETEAMKNNLPANQTPHGEINHSVYVRGSNKLNSAVGEGKGWKWGTGWAILGYLFFSPQASKGYEALGTTGLLLQLGGAITTISIYFMLRQNLLLERIQTTWIRSTCSGVIAYGIVWLLLFLAGKSILYSQYSEAKSAQSRHSQTEPERFDFVTSASEKIKKMDYDGALNDCNRALRDNQNLAIAYYVRALIKSMTGDSKGAMDDINRSIELDANSPQSYVIRSSLRKESDKQGALSDISKAIELNHDKNATSYAVRGQLELQLGDERGAKEDIRKSIEIFDKEISDDPKSAESYHGRALSRVLLGDTQGACSDLTKSYELGISQAADELKKYCR